MTKSLILYFSRAGNNYSSSGIKFIEIGNTEVIANYIKEFTDADMFKMDPLNEYPEDYMKCTEVAQEELQKDERPELKEYIDDISEYDVIYIAAPVAIALQAKAAVSAHKGKVLVYDVVHILGKTAKRSTMTFLQHAVPRMNELGI